MAILIIKSGHDEGREIRLRLGVNRVGRDSTNDIQIADPSISSVHCELEAVGETVAVRDCGSTNGTFIDGNPIESGTMRRGQALRLGVVEVFVESTEVTVAIPRFEMGPASVPPVVLRNGSMICPRHAGVISTHRCTFCLEIMCEECVTRIRRRGGKTLELCLKCSHHCERIVSKGKKKKGILGFLHETIKLPWIGKKKASLTETELTA